MGPAFLAQRADAFGHRVAVVVASASPAHYGVARAFEAHAGLKGLTVAVFTSLDEAARWVNAPD